ncbi:ABC transporter ATP-binding protein [Achromobacter seleniivolatilans]|uniref:ABC transporter ATP-binding protein n=1 Tax=Achromobacter seleniivolatilans TaxID=3047478 RepID=A0ABY9M5F7_9BURK|nr:ABC transporter ATP-binding protein [Achromobacter sp. R39]WMD22190.1 ABC transporter ATP-binding protein [Achromobacter sp. R39]
MNQKQNTTPVGLTAQAVSRHYAGVRAVHDVSFHLAPGQTLALIGPNGAGKSTLIQLLSGVARPSAGSIFLDGKRIDRLPPERICRMGLGRSFQTSRVFPALTVWESVLLGTQAAALRQLGGGLLNPLSEALGALVRSRGWRKRTGIQHERAEYAMRLFGDRLWQRRDAPAYSLSYANRRRLELARVLAGDPRYVLLDEPAAGMNPTETGELTELLLTLRRTHPELGLLVVEHKLSLVRQVADHLVVLNQGQVLAEGAPAQTLDDPAVIEAYLGRVRTRPSESDAHLG